MTLSCTGSGPGNPIPTPSPSATAAASPSATLAPEPKKCPCLVKWGVQAHNLQDAQGNLIHTGIPVLGGKALYDTTPRFARYDGDVRGGPANDEHNEFGVPCEQPDGPDFIASGPSESRRGNNPFQYQFVRIQKGAHKLIVKPRANLQDGLGRPVEICKWAENGAASEITFEVK